MGKLEDYIAETTPLTQQLQQLFSRDSALVIFDVGACECEDSIKYARLFPNARIHAFEPLAGNLARARAHLSAYRVGNVKLVEKALTWFTGEADFHVSSGRPAGVPADGWDYGNKSSSLLRPAMHLQVADFVAFKRRERVATDTLAHYCRQHRIQGIDFLHLDVQGAELDVLRGAGRMLSRTKSIWLEVSRVELYAGQPLLADVAAFMEEQGFMLVLDEVGTLAGDQFYCHKSFS